MEVSSPNGPPSLQQRTDELRMQALASHQTSLGQGDELVQILKQTIAQMERAHRRIQRMSIALFSTGLLVLLAGTAGVLLGDEATWAALVGGTGGLGALAAVFWTAPLDKVSASVNDLIKLEVAFLGYIRVIGEIDSGFQMQYLDILQSDKGNGTSLGQAIRDTTSQMREMMTATVELIDRHVSSPSADVREAVDALVERIDLLEKG
jgi:hypothetical protein